MADDDKFDELKRKSADLKARVDELRKRAEMPINPALGSPRIDAENADGRRDLKDDEDDD